MKVYVALCCVLVLAACGSVAPPNAKNLLEPVSETKDGNHALVDPHWRCQESDCYYEKAVPDANTICDHDPVPSVCAEKTEVDTAGASGFFCYVELWQHIHGH